MTAPAHPREGRPLQRVADQDRAVLDAVARGRLHHAWLLTGPEGVGKASFAYRAARRLLGGKGPADSLEVSPDDPVSRLISAQSHPDLLVLERETDGGRTKRDITVDQARRLPEFFAKSPAIAPLRVAIVDAMDDLNLNAANALLKTLEEPPGRGVLLLVSHAPGRLLATIRSRCRRLGFAPWPAEALRTFIEDELALPEADAARLAGMAEGAPGRALRLHAAGALEADRAAAELADSLPRFDPARAQAIADTFRGQEAGARLRLFIERLADRCRARALARPGTFAAARWAEARERLLHTLDQAEAVNLDRNDVFWTTMKLLRETVEVEARAC